MTARIIAVANQKGGVGKTTLTAALGAAWADAGRSVLLVDLDPQASLTSALGATPDPGFYRALKSYVTHPAADVPTVAGSPLPGGEYLIASHLDLAQAEAELIDAIKREYVLADLLAGAAQRHDLILVDCPPSLGLLTVNALTAATDVLIPVPPEYLAVQGLTRLMALVERVQKRLNPALRPAGVVPNMVKTFGRHLATEHRDMLERIREACERYEMPLLPAIPDQMSAAEAAGQGVPLTRYSGGNGAAEACRLLATTLLPEAHHAR